MLGFGMSGPDSERRKEIRRALRDAERRTAEHGLPASKVVLRALFDYVDARLEEGCDQTLKHTLEFANRHNLESNSLVKWLNEYGGYCDCEVIANVQDGCPAFRLS
jgi:hypothetical protein